MAGIENQSRVERLQQDYADLLARNAEIFAKSEREKADLLAKFAEILEQSEREKAAMQAAMEEFRKKMRNESNQSENFRSPPSSKDGSDSSEDGSDSPKDGPGSSIPTLSGNEGAVGSSAGGGGSVAASSLAEGEGKFNLNLVTYGSYIPIR